MPLAGMKSHPASLGYNLLWQGLDLLYPPVCAGCGQPGSRWCPTCQSEARRYPEHVCEHCGCPLGSSPASCCDECQNQTPPYQALRAWFVYAGPVREAIHTLKYRRNLGVGEALAKFLKDLVIFNGWKLDLVTAVPLSKVRMRERGYNQAAMLAFPLALSLGIPYRPGSLKRVRETLSQVGLTRSERRDNVLGAFWAAPDAVKGKCILVVDDVTTTGSTISACAEALLEGGAHKVYGVTLARVV